MKRIFVVFILFTVCITVFAQQAGRTSNRPTSEQTRENIKQYLEQSKANASQLDAIQADLNARNTGNEDERRFNQLKTEIERLELSIIMEQNKIAATLERGTKVNRETFDKVQRMIDSHKKKLAELEVFTYGYSSGK